MEETHKFRSSRTPSENTDSSEWTHTEFASKLCCCFDSSNNRLVAFTIIIISAFTYSTNYDMPNSIERDVKIFSIEDYQFDYLYSFYTLPSIVTCFFGGLLIDKVFGLDRGSVIFGLIALIGQVLITAGGFAGEYWMLLMGRFINGIGAETVLTSLICFSVFWFKTKELNLMFGVMMSITRLGFPIATSIFNPLYSSCKDYLNGYLRFGVAITPFLAISLFMVLLLVVLGHFSRINGKPVTKSEYPENTVQTKQLLAFPMLYWLALIMISVCNNAVMGFAIISQIFLEQKYGMGENEANYLKISFYLTFALASPLLGLLADKIGKDLFFNAVGLAVGILSQIIISATMLNPWIPLIMLAIFFSIMNSCGWSLVARIVKPYQLATAYGILMCFNNLVGTVATISVGVLFKNYGPLGVSLLLLGCFLFGAICCFIIWILDKKFNGILNYSSAQRRAIMNSFQ